MQQTVTVDLAVTTMVITFADGHEHVVNVNQCNDVTMFANKVVNNDQNATFAFPFNLPGPVTDYIPLDEQWLVTLHLNDGRVLPIPMGRVTNKGTWVNTQDGAAIAAEELGTYFFG